MNHKRLPPDSQLLRDFYEAALGRLGAVTDRPWHDRLSVLAEGQSARIWSEAQDFVETEIHFPPPETTAQRNAASEVFPGCPLTFRLVETVLREVPARFRLVIGDPEAKVPGRPVVEKLLRQQLDLGPLVRVGIGEFRPVWHFSVVVGLRAEVVAIDQTWDAVRLAFALDTGEADPHLEKELEFLPRPVGSAVGGSPVWPEIDETRLRAMIGENLLRDLAGPLGAIRKRQEQHLQRELVRIANYFSGYRAELETRWKRQRTDESRQRYRDRIAASAAEEKRRREDQVQRHEIRLIPHVDALLLTGERAWRAKVTLSDRAVQATYVVRARRWLGVGPARG